MLIKRANSVSPGMKMLIQKFVPFPAVGKDYSNNHGICPGTVAYSVELFYYCFRGGEMKCNK